MRADRIAALVVAGAGSFFVSVPEVYWALLAAMAADIVMGILRAIAQKQLASLIAFEGMLKKSAILILVGLATALGYFMGIRIPDFNIPLGQAVAIFFVIEESLSVLENAVALGVPVPRFLRDALMGRSPEKFGREG